MGDYIGIIILIVLAAAGLSAYIGVKRRIREVSQLAFGTDSIIEGLKKQEELEAETPKSVAGMTSLILPQIERDFPGFSLTEMIQDSEKALKNVLESIEEGSLRRMQGLSQDLREQTGLLIENNEQQGLKEEFSDVKVHKTAISKYAKTDGCCTITLQSAVEYKYLRWKAFEGKNEEPKKKQTRYCLEWLYVYDPMKVKESVRALAANCPNCGAPVKSLGVKKCPYCGSGIEVINRKMWALTSVKEM